MKLSSMIPLFVFTSFLIMSPSNGFNVLVAIPHSFRSLQGLFLTLSNELVSKNHTVTLLTPWKFNEEATGIKAVYLDGLEEVLTKNIFEISTNPIKNLELLYETIVLIVHNMWSNEEVKELWERRTTFDLIVTMSYVNEMTFPFLLNYTGVHVQVCTPGVEYNSMTRLGNWMSPAVVPNIFLSMDDNMKFWERVINLPMMIFVYVVEHYLIRKYQRDHLEKYFSDMSDLVSYYDRVALTLINGHFALDGPVPLLPSQIEIGTINAKKPQPLPKDLEDFLNGSGDAGVIFFSLGSIAKSSDIPQKSKEMFVEAFRRLPQRVLWKYEGTDLQLPPNVKTQSWMPQQDILGHPKTRVFISHCGNLGTQEAKYHGVPVLGVPIAFDQPRNAARMERKGYAIVLKWDVLATDKILDALDKLINDTTYKERLQALSSVLQDQKDSPAERAVWWLEYVVRHKGAPHLQYAGKRLSLFQYIMLDVILFWAAVFFSFSFIVFYILKLMCCRGTKIKRDSKQKDKEN